MSIPITMSASPLKFMFIWRYKYLFMYMFMFLFMFIASVVKISELHVCVALLNSGDTLQGSDADYCRKSNYILRLFYILKIH
jgi:hypothetical protein